MPELFKLYWVYIRSERTHTINIIMITKQELLDYGFVFDGSPNGRDCYHLGNFHIIDHFGVYHANQHNYCPKSKIWHSIEELDFYYRDWAQKQLQRISNQLIKLGQEQKVILDKLNLICSE